MTERVEKLISREKIEKRVKELAKQLDSDYAGKEIYMLCVLKGGVNFMVDLSREMESMVYINFMKVSSYDKKTISSGSIKILMDLDESIADKDVLIVEDIVDSGRTLNHLKNLLLSRNPKSIKICTFLDKPARREVPIQVDYVGFVIPDGFVIGYGLDYDQKYRNLDYVGILSFEE